jgi:hypothetical protein
MLKEKKIEQIAQQNYTLKVKKEIKTFSDKQKLREMKASSLALEEMLKRSSSETKSHRSKCWIVQRKEKYRE